MRARLRRASARAAREAGAVGSAAAFPRECASAWTVMHDGSGPAACRPRRTVALRPPFVLLLLLLLVVLLRRLMLLLLLRSRLRQLLRRCQLIAVGPVPHLLRSGRTSATCRTSAPLRSGRVSVRNHVLAASSDESPTGRPCGHDVDEKMVTLTNCSACTHLVKCQLAVPPTVFEL